MAVTQYIGSRYVPIFADPAEWSSAKEYEPLTIVLHEGNSYTSKQFVPVGIDIDNETYWAETGNYNAQVEQYRREASNASVAANNALNALPYESFEDVTVKSYIDNVASGINSSINEIADTIPIDAFGDETVKEYIDGFIDRARFVFHTTNSPTDTSWGLITLPKNEYTQSFSNTNGDFYDPESRQSNVVDFVDNNASDGMICTNCTFFGKDTSRRMNGQNHQGSYITDEDNRQLIAFGNDIRFYPLSTMLSDIPSSYKNVFECGYILINNGNINDDIVSITSREPRNAFGWDDDNYYIFYCEGRGFYQYGLTFYEVAQILASFDITNAVEFDGGGSTQFVEKVQGTAEKINYYRDFSIWPMTCRNTPSVAIYTPKNGGNSGKSIAQRYRSYFNGYVDFDMYKNYNTTMNIAENLGDFVTIPANSVPTYKLNKYAYKDNVQDYAPNNESSIALPYMTYDNDFVEFNGIIHLIIPANSISNYAEMRIGIGIVDVATGDASVTRYERLTFLPTTYDYRVQIPVKLQEPIPDGKHQYIIRPQIQLYAGNITNYTIGRSNFSCHIDKKDV